MEWFPSTQTDRIGCRSCSRSSASNQSYGLALPAICAVTAKWTERFWSSNQNRCSSDPSGRLMLDALSAIWVESNSPQSIRLAVLPIEALLRVIICDNGEPTHPGKECLRETASSARGACVECGPITQIEFSNEIDKDRLSTLKYAHFRRSSGR